MNSHNIVYVHESNTFDYPNAPFHPSQVYPEFNSNFLFQMETNKANTVYNSVRETLIGLKFDAENEGMNKWNPFKNYVKSGQSVVIKPNLVYHDHPFGIKGTLSTITNASIIRPIIDYVLLATGGDCKITVCDVPLQSANWETIITINGLKDLVKFYKERNIDINLLDLRYEISTKNKQKIIVKRDFRVRDPLGYAYVDLGKKSELMPIINYCDRFEITDYGSGTVPKHHNPEKNEYCIAKTILECDFFINIPKLKTHRKAGLTCAMKNVIGINADKSWIAHHTRGKKGSGGDEFKDVQLYPLLKRRLFSFLKRHKSLLPLASLLKWTFEKIIHRGRIEEKRMCGSKYFTEGSWHGNDTLWRCIKDLNKIILYSDKSGKMQNRTQRNYLCIVDGIIAGEKEGPMEQTPKKAGVILGGTNAVYIDKIAADIMGFDYIKIPQIREGFNNKYWDLINVSSEDIVLKSNIEDPDNLNLNFIPTSGWKNYIEIGSTFHKK